MPYYVYILATRKNGALYVGVTNDLVGRVQEHKAEVASGSAKRAGPKLLVYVEAAKNIEAAIVREKYIKKWERSWRLQLIERSNPGWLDLYTALLKENPSP